jgi:hypothetical protein
MRAKYCTVGNPNHHRPDCTRRPLALQQMCPHKQQLHSVLPRLGGQRRDKSWCRNDPDCCPALSFQSSSCSIRVFSCPPLCSCQIWAHTREPARRHICMIPKSRVHNNNLDRGPPARRRAGLHSCAGAKPTMHCGRLERHQLARIQRRLSETQLDTKHDTRARRKDCDRRRHFDIFSFLGYRDIAPGGMR